MTSLTPTVGPAPAVITDFAPAVLMPSSSRIWAITVTPGKQGAYAVNVKATGPSAAIR